MATKGIASLNEAVRGLIIGSGAYRKARVNRIPPLLQSHSHSRTMATEAPMPPHEPPTTPNLTWRPTSTVPVTIYSFPSLEPVALEDWSVAHLHLPLRRDILHQAVVYEGHAHRQGSASTKTPWEVHGSHRKVAPQKGLGIARVGWKQSPLRRGGGVMFGPKPKDWSIGLPRKVYDLAWRTALSYRYRRGELVVVADGVEMPLPDEFLVLAGKKKLYREIEDAFVERYMTETLRTLKWGRSAGRTTFITQERRPNLFASMETVWRDGRAMTVGEVDVKDLLETGRIVVERAALQHMIMRHQSDLASSITFNGARKPPPQAGAVVIDQNEDE